MPIHYEHGVDVAVTPERAFALLDDVSRTPDWLERCVRLEKLTPEPNAVGTKLRYSYREGSRTGVMDGEIATRTPNERLTFHYADKMMDVIVDFRMSPNSSGTRLVHAITIAPKTFFAKLLTPLIRWTLPKQTIAAMTKLKGLLEGKNKSFDS